MAKQKKMTVHKEIRSDRPNGKAFKQHPKGFSTVDRRLVTVSQELKGTTGSWL